MQTIAKTLVVLALLLAFTTISVYFYMNSWIAGGIVTAIFMAILGCVLEGIADNKKSN